LSGRYTCRGRHHASSRRPARRVGQGTSPPWGGVRGSLEDRGENRGYA
jgi:hypothetical protein